MNFRFLVVIAGALPLAAASVDQPNQKSTVRTTLPHIVVTATRRDEDPANVPAPVRTDDAVAMAERQARTLPEALREMPSVLVQKTSNGQGSPFVRGFTGFRNLTLIDGIRFNNSTFREGPNQYTNTIDSFAVDRIELVPGQGSVLFGSDSIGGTLNFFTKDSRFQDQSPGYFFHGLSSYRGATAEESNAGHVEIQTGEGGKWGLHLGASLKSFGDVHAAEFGDQPRTGYNEWAYDGRLDLALDPDWTLTAVHQQLRQDDVWRTHATIYGRSWEGTTVGTDLRRSFDQDRTLSYLRLTGENLDGIIDAARLTVSVQSANEYEHRIRRVVDNRIDFTQVELATLGFELQFESYSPVGTLTYGVDYYRDWVSSGSQRYRLNGTLHSMGFQGPVGDEADYHLLGAFLQDQIDIHQRVHLVLGGRSTFAAADVGRFQIPAMAPAPARTGSFEDEWQDFSASGRILIDLDEEEHFKVYAGISQSFRAPNLSDLSRLDIARSGELEIPSPGLEPEQFVHLEMGLKAGTDRWSGSIAYFYTDIDDMIIRRPTGQVVGPNAVVVKQNGGDGYVQGLEVAGDYRFDKNWSTFAHLTLMQGKVDQFPYTGSTIKTREPLSRVVPIMGRAGVRWQSNDRKLWSELVCLAHSRANKLNSSDRRDTDRIPPGGTPGFALLTLRGGWEVTEKVSLTLALENLLDEDYRFHGSGSNEPGFGAVLGATVRY